MKYHILISNPEKIIENWYEKDTLESLIGSPLDGLCDNIKYHSTKEIPNELFECWKYFSGEHPYPVDGKVEYELGLKEPYFLFKNPKRLHLAVHMLQWLRFNSM